MALNWDSIGRRAFGRPPVIAGNAHPSFPYRSLLRLVAAALLIFALLWFVDLRALQDHLARLSWPSIAGMIALHAVIIQLCALRFACIARASGAIVPTREASRLTFGSTLANMLLPTSLAGDAARVWLIQRHGLGGRSAIGVGVLDRVLGLASLGIVVLAGTVAAPSVFPVGGTVSLVILAVFLGGGLVVAMRLGCAEMIAVTVGYSLAAHAVSIVIAYLFLRDQAASISIGELSVLFPAVILAASIPVSMGGWGTRELAAAAAFGLVGMEAEAAIALAFAFGVTQTLAAGLGTSLFWALRPSGTPSHD